MSRVINRKIVAGVERRKAPDPPGGPSRPPSCPPDHRVRITRVRMNNGQQKGTRSDSCDDFTRIEYVKRSTNLKSTKKFAVSVPDCLDKLDEDSYSISGSLGSRLWLDGSPPPVGRSNPPVYPQRSASVENLSWDYPEERDSTSPPEKQTSFSLSSRKDQAITAAAMDLEGCQLQPTQKEGRSLYQCSVSVNNILSLQPLEGEQESAELQPRSNSLGTEQERPVPKPRKGKALERRVDSKQSSESDRNSTSSLQPSIRPRTTSSSNKSKRPSSLGMRPRKGSGLPKRKLSPPALPPPPPPESSFQPPTIVFTPPEPPRHRDSGPPKFIPPPPPQSPPLMD